MNKTLNFFLMIFLTSNIIMPQTAKNIQRSGYISTETLYNRSINYLEEYTISDVWGWSFNGNEYALIGMQSNVSGESGVALIDVTDPDNIKNFMNITFLPLVLNCV